MNKVLLYVSLILVCFIAFGRADDDLDLGLPDGIEIDGEGENQYIKLSKEKAKREGWLPWDQWYDTEEYSNYKKVVTNMFHPLKRSTGFYFDTCKNISYMSMEKYEFYIRNWKESVIDANTTTVVIMGGTHHNETMWVAGQIQEAINRYNLMDYSPFLRFAYVEKRFDENLHVAFDPRFYMTLYVIDDTFNGVDNGTVFQWDTYKWPDNETIGDWILNQTYKNSSISFPTPRYLFEDEMKQYYIKRWFRENFGGRFCRFLEMKARPLHKAAQFICDGNDVSRKNEDKFTMVVAPLLLIFFVLPWLWWFLRQCCGCICWCCQWEIYVDEADLEKKDN